MDWMTRLNDALDYVEGHLCEEPDEDAIARRMACSYELFLRFFTQLAGIPLSEYIRRRRLSQAAYDIRNTDERIIDIAAKYGYDSSDAFAVAFKRLHGVAPMAARRGGIALKFFTRLKFTMMIKGEHEMDYKLIRKEPFHLAGVRRITSTGGGTWGIVKADGTIDKLQALAGKEVLMGLCFGFDADGRNDYMVAAETKEAPSGLDTYRYPESAFLIFQASGTISGGVLGNTWGRIYGEFLPQSEYRQRETPTIERYLAWDEAADQCEVEIWIPVED